MYAVEVSDVLKRFSNGSGMNVIFEDLNFRVSEGELVIVRGTRGSGKSTLLNMIAAMTPPNKGSVKVFGQNLLTLRKRPEWRMENIGFITDDCCLMPYLTPKQNLLLGIPTDSPKYEEIEKQTEALLINLGLCYETMNENVEGLDVKEQILATIGRIFMTKPKLVLADEPTKALDGYQGMEVLERLIHFAKNSGTTVIIVSNDQQLIDHADRTMKVENGKIVTLEPPEPVQ